MKMRLIAIVLGVTLVMVDGHAQFTRYNPVREQLRSLERVQAEQTRELRRQTEALEDQNRIAQGRKTLAEERAASAKKIETQWYKTLTNQQAIAAKRKAQIEASRATAQAESAQKVEINDKRFLQQRAEDGSASAQYQMGMQSLAANDTSGAINWLGKAAANGSEEAKAELRKLAARPKPKKDADAVPPEKH